MLSVTLQATEFIIHRATYAGRQSITHGAAKSDCHYCFTKVMVCNSLSWSHNNKCGYNNYDIIGDIIIFSDETISYSIK